GYLFSLERCCLNHCSVRNFMFARLFCVERRANILGLVQNARRTDCLREEPDGEAQVKKELIDRLLEVSRQAAREVESAVSTVKDPHLRGIMAGVIMQRILDEVDTNDRGASATISSASSASSSFSGDPARKSGTQSRILDLRSDSFFRE